MPLPEDEASWDKLDVMFATTRGTVRRNKLSDFVDVRRSGIIAMKLDEGDAIVDVQICTENDDVLLTTRRRPVHPLRRSTDVRVFQGRTSMGVRGIALGDGDKVISLSILRHVEATAEERAAYLKRASAVRRGSNGDGEEASGADAEEADAARSSSASSATSSCRRPSSSCSRSPRRAIGKRTSSYEYRITGRGGKGIVAMAVTEQQRPAGRLVPGRGERPDHAGHQRRPADPLPGRRHPHRRPLDARA